MKHIKQQHFNYQAPPQGSVLLACSSGTCRVPDFKGLDSADAINLTEDAVHKKEFSLNYLVCKLGGLLVLLALGMMPVPKVQAADFNVACADSAGLISAIDNANANSEADTIHLSAACTYTLTVVNNTGIEFLDFNGLPIITSEITIEGNGAIIQRDGSAPKFRIIQNVPEGELTLNRVTIRGGLGTRGAGIKNTGTLTVKNSTISDNKALAIFNDVIVAPSLGGGIYAESGQTIILNSTFSGNEGKGSGILAQIDGTLTIRHSTFSNNSIIFDTNTLLAFGSITMAMSNSIIANNDARDSQCFSSTLKDEGYNIVEDGTCISAPTSFSGDPLLGSLADNGGPTMTHALLPGSPAIDAITDAAACTLATDQRGITRPQGSACDIGAYEVEEIVCDASIVLSPASLPDGQVGDQYQDVYSASSGTAPYSFDVRGGLPFGISFSPAGILSGSATSGGLFNFELLAKDAAGKFGCQQNTVEIFSSPSQIPTGLISWWQAEDDAIDAIGTNHGTAQGSAGFASGHVGQAFQFDGSDGYMALPDNLFPFPTTGNTSNTPFSFETWFATTESGVILGQQGLTGPYTETAGSVPAIYVGLDGKLRAELFWGGSESPISSDKKVNTGNFHHLAVVYDGSNETIYLDGAVIGSGARTQTAYADSYTYQFGTGVGGNRSAIFNGWSNFNGRIDEPSLYDRVLTAREIQDIFVAGNAGKVDDTTAPTANLVQSPVANGAGWNNSDVTVNWNWTDVGGVGIDFSNCTLSTISSSEGINNLDASCADLVNNTGLAIYRVQLDKTAADTSLDVTPPASSNSTDASFEFSGSDAGSGIARFECQLDGADFTTCTSPQSYSNLSEGQHSIAIRAVDQADNVDPSPALHLWTINTNVPPVAVADNYSIDQDTVLTVPAPGVLDNDSDTDGNPLTAVLDTPPTNGTLNLNADGSFEYTPAPGYVGNDSFSYHANDGTADSNIVTVEITVNGVTTVFASCGGYDVFEIAPGVYEAPDFAGNLIVGTNGRNTIKSTNGPDLILGLGGADDIKGKRGDDVICGGKGADFIRGNNGQDILYGDAGFDWLIGGNGADTLYGGKGSDYLEGKNGRDSLFGEAGFDVLLGGRGNDELDGGNGFDICTGGPGNDTLTDC